MSEYKAAKEAFVADNPGTTIWEVQLVSCIGVISYALYCSISTLPRPITPYSPLNRVLSSPMLDFLTTFLPLLLGLTVFADVPFVYQGTLLFVIFLIQAEGSLRGNWKRMHGNARSRISKPPPKALRTRASTSPSATSSSLGTLPPTQTPLHFPHTPFLTIHRAHLSLMTTLCILAVDFAIFPRRFGKTETFGNGLMDVGVGSFVLSAGIGAGGGWLKGEVGRMVRGESGLRGEGHRLGDQLWRAGRRAIPLVALGMIRVIVVKGVEYPEHITEYGVHWNFFFTLAVMPFVLPIFSCIRQRAGLGRYWILAFGLAVCDELLLKVYLEPWVLSPSRVDLLGMNKEGLVSLAGYIAIYLFGVDLGCMIIPPDPAFLRDLSSSKGMKSGARYEGIAKIKRRMTSRRRPFETGKVLAWYACAAWVALGLVRSIGQPVSRRMANLPYVLWTVAFNSTFLLGYLAVELWYFSPDQPASFKIVHAVPPLLKAVDRNGLVLFLLANLLTGGINISVETMYAGPVTSMTILAAYAGLFSSLAWTIRKRRIAF